MKADQNPAVAICSYHHLANFLDRHEVHHVVSIMSDAEWKRFPAPSFGNRKVLRLRFEDVDYARDRLVTASRDHIAALIDFGRAWNGAGTLLCHCRAGVSRSSAAALIVAAVVRPSSWMAVATRVAQARAYYKPNSRMLSYADDIIGLSPGLADLVRSLPRPDRIDDWQPSVISLD